jgi:diketogulonate reductase-like aldo/keto reductase
VEILASKQQMPLIGLGTYRLQEEQLLTELLRKGLQIGYCRHLDTARLYNNEIPLGKAIKTVIAEGRVKREELFIASKIFNCKHENVQHEVKEILQLMQLKYIDLLYLHWPFIDMDEHGEFQHRAIEEVWADMELCVTKGYVRNLGISNFNGQAIMDLLTYCTIKPSVLQVELHPYLPNNALVELAQKNGIVVMAYSPLVRGHNLNKDDIDILKEEAILDVAAKHGKTSGQVVLKTALQRGIGVIPRTSNPARLQENYESWTFELGEDDWKKIRPLGRGYRVCDGANLFSTFATFD